MRTKAAPTVPKPAYIYSVIQHNTIFEKRRGSQHQHIDPARTIVRALLFLHSVALKRLIFGYSIVLNLRVATVGAQEHLLACTEELLYRVVDVSGASCAVRHWASFFVSADAILFLVDSSAYNIPSSAIIPDSNKLADALTLFAETVDHPLLQKVRSIGLSSTYLQNRLNPCLD